MKKSLARNLRRIAERLEPSYLQSYDVTYEAGMPTHVDFHFRLGGGKERRVFGYVDSTERI